MTVSMPTMSTKDEYGMPITYTGCQVTLQHRKTSQFGRANQKWSYDSASGFIFAFSASGMDKGNFWLFFTCLFMPFRGSMVMVNRQKCLNYSHSGIK